MIRPSSSARLKAIPLVSPHVTNVTQAMSKDGRTVVLYMQGGGDLSYRWTQAGGAVLIPNMATYTNAFALGVSKTGSVIVGDAFKSGQGRRAWYWTPGGGTVAMSNGNTAYAVTDSNGTMIIAGSRTNGSFGWRFTVATGIVDLTRLEGATFAQAFCISDDGSLIGGYCDDGSGQRIPCIWDAGGSPTGITPPAGFDGGQVTGFSRDGTWVVGNYYDSASFDPGGGFVWSVATGLIDLGLNVFPLDISGNGKVIVGFLSTDAGNKGFRMPFGGVPRIIEDSLGQIKSVSEDGLIAAGNKRTGVQPTARHVMLVH